MLRRKRAELPDHLLTSADLGRLLRKTAGAIRVMRHRNPDCLPPAIVINTRLFWDPRDVEEWLGGLKQVSGPGSDRTAGQRRDDVNVPGSG
jgi:hypothetical protein